MKSRSTYLLLFLCMAGYFSSILGQSSSVNQYPDEQGFKLRTKGIINELAKQNFGQKGKATSTCPDTGKPFSNYALEGETIISPYSGRALIQGPTGFFGAKKRDDAGRIVAFGGDAMKYDLPPATAALMLDPNNQKALDMVSIPGFLNQQFFFPAVNWTRMYGLVGENMESTWKDSLQKSVANYINYQHFDATGRPSLGKLSFPHSLVGQPGEVLGGNAYDGGTENHKTMLRTSGLLYSQWFGPDAIISQQKSQIADSLITYMLQDYLRRCLTSGNGEYLSSIYYPYAMMGYLNLHDFSPDPAIKNLAKAQLDFYLTTYALCSLDGVIVGPQRRGYLSMGKPNGMEKYLWLWAGQGNWNLDSTDLADKVILHPATSSYRPNKVITNLLTKQLALPYEAYIAHPDYHLTRTNVHQEYLYMSRSFGMGSTTVDQINNPSQQVVWSLVLKGKGRPLNLGGGHPRYPFPSGHSPYSQVLQKEGTLILLTRQHEGVPPPKDLRKDRGSWFYHTEESLQPTNWPENEDSDAWTEFLENAPKRAESWFYAPKAAHQKIENKGILYMEFEQTYLAVRPMGTSTRWLHLPDHKDVQQAVKSSKSLKKSLAYYDIWVISGSNSGFILEAVEADEYKSFENFVSHYPDQSKVDTTRISKGMVRYTSTANNKIDFQFEPQQLKPSGKINGKRLNYQKWADGGVYKSPYLTIKNGSMYITDREDTIHLQMDAQHQLKEASN